jgi:hypothetical protein
MEFFTREKMLPLFLATPFKMQYIQFVSTILDVHPKNESCDNYEAFTANGNGYLKLWLRPSWKRDHFDLFMHEGTPYSIVSSYWIDVCAPSTLAKGPGNRVPWLMMDTIWTILRLSVMAILVAVSRSAAVPLAFAFGPIESAELYELFWTLFHDEFHIELSEYT